jgi:hypothetical protein
MAIPLLQGLEENKIKYWTHKLKWRIIQRKKEKNKVIPKAKKTYL